MPKKYASKLPFAMGSFYNNSNDLLADVENNAMLVTLHYHVFKK